jgi:hypothetical protein
MAKSVKKSTNSKSPAAKKTGVITKAQYIGQAQVESVSYNDMIMLAIKERKPIEYINALIAEKNKEKAESARIEFIDAKRMFMKSCPPILKNKYVKGEQSDYAYAELSNTIETIKKSETDNGFVHDWKTTYENEFLVVTCIVSHIGGHTESDSMRAVPDATGGKNSIQADSSSISYMRRITLMGVFGLSAKGDDNDGRGILEQPSWTNLPYPSKQQFDEVVKKIYSGSITVEDVCAVYRLTDDQLGALNQIMSHGKKV